MTAAEWQRRLALEAAEVAAQHDADRADLAAAYRRAAAAHSACAARLEALGLVDDADPAAVALMTHYRRIDDAGRRVPLCGRGRPGRIEASATCPECRRTLAAGARHTAGPPADLAALARLTAGEMDKRPTSEARE